MSEELIQKTKDLTKQNWEEGEHSFDVVKEEDKIKIQLVGHLEDNIENIIGLFNSNLINLDKTKEFLQNHDSDEALDYLLREKNYDFNEDEEDYEEDEEDFEEEEEEE